MMIMKICTVRFHLPLPVVFHCWKQVSKWLVQRNDRLSLVESPRRCWCHPLERFLYSQVHRVPPVRCSRRTSVIRLTMVRWIDLHRVSHVAVVDVAHANKRMSRPSIARVHHLTNEPRLSVGRRWKRNGRWTNAQQVPSIIGSVGSKVSMTMAWFRCRTHPHPHRNHRWERPVDETFPCKMPR